MIKYLLDFHEGLDFDHIPTAVVTQAKRCLLDWIGVTLSGMNEPAASIVMEALLELGGKEQASIIGTGIKTSTHHAAFINGTASHVLDFDDTHLGALMHPSVTVLPAVLACGEARNVNGREFLLSYIAGVEMETRISLAMGAAHYDAGWHSTATMGRFGAAAAVAKLIGLDRKQSANALGLAGTQSSGLRKVFGTMTKPFHPGKAAADGILCAVLAGKGFTCSEDIFSGDKGLGALISSDYNPERGMDGLGKRYNILGISIKPFASCLYTHPTIDGILHLRESQSIKPEQVKRIFCRVSRFCHDAACQRDPRTGLAGKFSTYYCAALAVLAGKVGENDFQDSRLFDPAVRAMMSRVSIEESRELTESEAEVRIELADGQLFEHKVPFPIGDPRKPLSDEHVELKFRGLVAGVLSEKQIGSVLDLVASIEEMNDIAELPGLLIRRK